MMKTLLSKPSSPMLFESYSRSKEIFVEIVSKLFILLFVYAAVSKILVFEEFEAQIGQSPLLTSFASWIVWIVPIVEILISCLLATVRYKLIALYASFSLMVMFTTYIITILGFSSYIPCSCGGILEKLGWTEHLIFNSVFIIMSAFAIYFFDEKGE